MYYKNEIANQRQQPVEIECEFLCRDCFYDLSAQI